LALRFAICAQTGERLHRAYTLHDPLPRARAKAHPHEARHHTRRPPRPCRAIVGVAGPRASCRGRASRTTSPARWWRATMRASWGPARSTCTAAPPLLAPSPSPTQLRGRGSGGPHRGRPSIWPGAARAHGVSPSPRQPGGSSRSSASRRSRGPGWSRRAGVAGVHAGLPEVCVGDGEAAVS